MAKEKIYIVIPAKDEEERIARVLSRTISLGYDHIVVVDDGSQDQTFRQATRFPVFVLRHPVNLGAGAATQTGIEFAISKGADLIVTMDGDTQHFPEDIAPMVDLLRQQGCDLVIGNRFRNPDNRIPLTRVFYNKVANFISYLVTGVYVRDSQSGMKAMTSEFAGHFEITWNGFEFCIEQLRNARRYKARIREIPIRVSYTRETMKKGQSFLTGLKMLGKIIKSN